MDDDQYTVRAYNPFQNREEYYSWEEFYDAWNWAEDDFVRAVAWKRWGLREENIPE